MSDTTTGGCMCGNIRYTLSDQAAFTLICQCRQCQQISGSGHAAQFAVSVDATTLEGELKFYNLKADDGNAVSSGFCGHCGNPILKKTTAAPEYLFFHAATLDDPSHYQPQMLVYSQSAQPWDYVNPDIPRK